MSRIRAQRSILSAEYFWLGGHLGAPKVYDTGTNFHASPTLRDSMPDGDRDCDAGTEGSKRTFRYSSNESGWEVTFDKA